MAVVKEWNCPTHGTFESRFSMCPHGCVDVERVFLTPPAVKSIRTKNIDRTLNQMARERRLSDISNKKGSLAASVPQFQPKPLTMDPGGVPGVSAYFDQQKRLFGGNIEMGKDGSFWARGMSFQRGTSRVTGEKVMDSYGVADVATGPTAVVQYACDDSGKVIPTKGK